MQIKALIFDMDGVLIDSEPHWSIAEQEAFASVGVFLKPNEAVQTMGIRISEVISFWREKYPWENVSNEEVARRMIDAQIKWVLESGVKEIGVDFVFALAKKIGLKIALASSSPQRVIDVVVKKLGIADKLDLSYSAEFEKHGKPAPDVFLHTAQALGVDPTVCVVIEDSINGFKAAVAAGMRCIAIPDPHFLDREEIKLADFVISSLEEVTREMLS